MAEAFERASITCRATGLTGGVDVSVEWFRNEDHERLEEDSRRQFTVDKHEGTLTIVEVGECLLTPWNTSQTALCVASRTCHCARLSPVSAAVIMSIV